MGRRRNASYILDENQIETYHALLSGVFPKIQVKIVVRYLIVFEIFVKAVKTRLTHVHL